MHVTWTTCMFLRYVCWLLHCIILIRLRLFELLFCFISKQLTLSFANCFLQVEPSPQVHDEILQTTAESDTGYIVEVSVSVKKHVKLAHIQYCMYLCVCIGLYAQKKPCQACTHLCAQKKKKTMSSLHTSITVCICVLLSVRMLMIAFGFSC